MKVLRELLTTGSCKEGLDAAALDLASIEHPGLDPAPWIADLDRIAVEISAHARDLSNGHEFIRATNAYLFDEMGFHGNDAFYYDPRNSCLNDVIAFRTGIPITLSLVYMEVARRLAKTVVGIGAPGHFIVRYDDLGLSVFIDPFRGGLLIEPADCLEELRRITGIDMDAAALEPVSPKQLMVRMLRNMEGAYLRLGRFDQALAVTELLQLADPGVASRFPRLRESQN